MRLVKALAGGVIGGAISAAIIVGAGAYYFLDVPSWLALVAGVVTGLGVRMMGKSDKPGPCYACGAIAALLTLAAFYGGTFAASSLMEANVDNTQIKLQADKLPEGMKTAPPATSSAEDDLPAEDSEPAVEGEPGSETPAAEEPAAESDPATDDEPAANEPAANEPAVVEVVDEEVIEVVEPAEATTIPVVKVDRPQPVKEDFNVLSYVFIVVGALIAYELGRSCGCSKGAT